MASVFNKMGRQDSAIYYGSRAVEEHLKRPYYPGVINAGNASVDIFKSKGALDSAFKYQEIVLAAKDSLFSREKVNNLQNLSFNEQHRQQEAHAQQARYRNKLRMNTVLGITFTLLVVALLLWRNIRHQQKSYSLLQKQKQETEQLRVKAEDALTELKATQAQLLQREKMASLGELTAGIAHEIQNPLNFVNNFSEINKELIGELKQEAHSGNITEVIAIADNLEENEQKIARHGKRADNIVKGMLEHSRTSKGEKQFTDINALADEYLRLSYHGIRAKDKSFNATIETHYDESIGKISVVPQDIGRVLLNLFNNAFYAVTQKKKATDQKGENYEPTVLTNTKRENDKVIIAVRDNGIGIPQKVVDKIFQPFFTTKPTGQGTGLGLSLSYDIVKAHGGELKVETKEGEYAEFTVIL
jgi:signal transduction histidine kinase